ncbi:cytochrome-c peroxidase [Pseudomonas japonica]|uniref:Methylamine utilization protein MauG n=1 Tax=Pseudomonas japonica TaxID=256466 RepID=A0A239C831_9PSED|nr:cytochrome c peroxidase [Pseudomonas japonica]SNS15818.1 cytochrome c peroxidase [Pseudomonas japonica]
MSISLKKTFPVITALSSLVMTSVDAYTAQGQDQFILKIPSGLIEPDIPNNNPLTERKISLGKKLFFDRRLSHDSVLSCSTCHDPTLGFAENRTVSFSAHGKNLERNAPSVFNTGYLPSLGWDGRFSSLEIQVSQPFSQDNDMGITIDEAISKIESLPDYQGLFEDAFGRSIDSKAIAEALASYQRSLVSGDSRFDDYLFKGNREAITKQEQRGYEIFIGKASCINCHDIFHPSVNSLGGGFAVFSDFRFHNLGVGYENGKMKDTGRYWVTRKMEDWGAFKTPMLRNIELTPPYMHDGSLSTLQDVVEFYNKGGIKNPNLAPGIRPLYLSDDEVQAIVMFLKSLTDKNLLNDELANK